ncbi:MAG TPA: aldehyde dehydrogenase family protein [Crenotrichaceae bacterium]|nr:aldehyde dehydrogenase family protein [Crenotrichaceae bacterium]
MTTKQYPIYVGGSFQKTDNELDVVNPYSGEVCFTTFLAAAAQFEQATQAAVAVRSEMQNLPAYQRYEILMSISQQIDAASGEFATLMANEAGKPYSTALAEVGRAVQTFLVAAEESKRLPGEVLSLDWMPNAAGKHGVVEYFPVGLVAGITPFNFPLNLVAHKVAPAIAAGCPMVLKPASSTPVTALKLAEIIDRTSLPKGAFSVLPMDRQTGNRLVTDDRYQLLTFTGSAEVGWLMKKNSGKKKIVLELGGNAGLIIEADADLDKATSKAVVGGFSYAGQSCIHTQRIYVHTSVYDDFTERYVKAVKALKVGDPLKPETAVASMIDENNAYRIEQWVNEAVQAGATMLCGGVRKGALYQPTVMTNTKPDMKVTYEEAFAPVVVIEKYTDFKQAVDAVNESAYGLQAGVFTNDNRKIRYAFTHLEVGGLTVNETPTFRADHMPYGGVKDSGIGREGPKYAIHDMLEPRILVFEDTNFL